MADDTGAPSAEGDAEPEATQDLLFDVPVTTSLGQTVLHVGVAGYGDLVRRLHDDGYLMCVDLTAVDYLTFEGDRQVPPSVDVERFEVVANFVSHTKRERVRVRAQVAEEAPLPSITDLYPGVDAMEREAFDMFGLTFEGHPDHTRILMPEDWVGHPLRKDYNSGRIPVQFKNPVSRPDVVAP
jgi:NADH:ubiquinone oxidoreductase subunit C